MGIPPMSLVFVPTFVHLHSFPARITHEILVHNMAYTVRIHLIDRSVPRIVIDRRNLAIRMLDMSFQDASPCTSESQNGYGSLRVSYYSIVMRQRNEVWKGDICSRDGGEK